MQVVKNKETNKVSPSATTTIWEYLADSQDISGAVAQVNGRYPEKGFAVNEISKELAFVVSGNGKIVSSSGETSLDLGDVILIQPNEPFAWEGNFTIFMATAPTFDPKQHKIHKII
ncbi:hypothetical protein A3A64_02210 [Candidatus Gottesmanbacteria bacterium RIFCSPLOWO2_01_FULL_48_11]|uniref:(S)-ureidoglycine aminohydrolase cupin domain-containing protein n=3 Tax=Candidatus Gottesmaniibacteriota TaxID=1752720 RepID=A0A0G1WZW7_9BACT|nr:MAG: hypothetical protein UY16_C0019G0006 [Candidatus Gottesmanbacteria bacterium GW2011_GWA2_47_9]KKU95863.1 MAG: hypothetical protein UY27_C0007G0031 [Candidatus Gottesmanbacteria bacterium GW2011_GWA1_48_13]OGG27146.1 MAG: hypothetical protein A3A64_02210 [Candidatus Gottesmanbacteria bacterium RIFCSPLOWO2_01_FULL_48_11]